MLQFLGELKKLVPRLEWNKCSTPKNKWGNIQKKKKKKNV